MFHSDNIFIAVGIQVAKAAAALIAAAILILFLQGEIARITEEGVDRQKLIATTNISDSDITQARTHLAAALTYMETIDAALLDIDRIDDFIVAIEELATTHSVGPAGITFGSIAPAAASTEALSLSRVPVTVTVGGSLDAINAFVRAFENLPYFAGIDKITVDGTGAENLSVSARAMLSGFIITQ